MRKLNLKLTKIINNIYLYYKWKKYNNFQDDRDKLEKIMENENIHATPVKKKKSILYYNLKINNH